MDNRYVQQFKKGALEMILLCLIGREETYGYEIISQLNQRAMPRRGRCIPFCTGCRRRS